MFEIVYVFNFCETVKCSDKQVAVYEGLQILGDLTENCDIIAYSSNPIFSHIDDIAEKGVQIQYTGDTFRQQNLHKRLPEADPQLQKIIENEMQRQNTSISLIPFENRASVSVNQALGSIMNCKYSEGYPNLRYYGGNEYIDQMEILCQNRALSLFNLNKKEWRVNVQCLSGSPANFYVVSALINNHERVMSLNPFEGGHISHGLQLGREKISAVSKYFDVLNYGLKDDKTIDYDKLEELSSHYLPKLIIGGANVYPRQINYSKLRQICDKINAQLLIDISDVAGLISTGLIESPFPYADVVTTTTHKSLRGPRGALVFCNLKDQNLIQKVDFAIFPGNQGGPHNHTITSIGVALKEAQSISFKQYAKQVVMNAKKLSGFLQYKGFQVFTGGTDNHLVSIDLSNKEVKGNVIEEFLEQVNIIVTGCRIQGQQNNLLHLGTYDLTNRGCEEQDMEIVGGFIIQACEILKGKVIIEEELKNNQKVLDLKKKVQNFCQKKQY
ncbi:serine hydroxymethyltransferase, putative [Ichthyophthirius multifiliis]|uniref:Serine hydroxymethyltransferase n=1 Tax=Ichthyophthirius multifiliis TaxID=5932 RepID=G0R1J0_ICHMU|nr:serine hydroxymethyltransferase, putative [Ichthyophthirius multifiliis]EGR28663.1 serine hydroxymethyltransferase, putative [Ichthyophthirius multifiliis]|eukprot:XP_004029899.1 serine hydroxymethyltransferase, putative [Ichthyophthirius multifiliis]